MGGLTTLPERVVTLLLVVVVGFAIPTVGFTTGLEAFDLGVDLGVGAFGLVDTVFVSIVAGTGSGVLCMSAETEILGIR